MEVVQINFVSTDITRIDFCCQFFCVLFSSPFQLTLCLILLLTNMGRFPLLVDITLCLIGMRTGWSAIVGYALFFIVLPLQTRVMSLLYRFRKQCMVWTDKRAKILGELMAGMRIIKWVIPLVLLLMNIY